MLCITALNVIVNSVLMLIKTYYSLKMSIEKLWSKFKLWRLKRSGLYLEGTQGGKAPEFVQAVFKNI